MKQLVLRVSLMAAANIAAAALWLAYEQSPTNCERWETDANLDVMPRAAQLDVLIAGSSHGWALTACAESARSVTDHLGSDTLNLSKKGCGPLPALCYLEAFFARGNRTETLVYFIDPWAVAYSRWNENAPFLRDEPFNAPFWWRAANNGVRIQQLAAATRAQFARSGADVMQRAAWCSRQLDEIRPEAAERRRDYLYPEAFDADNVSQYAPVVENIVRLATGHGAQVLFIIPPTLLGDLTGTTELHALLNNLETELNIDWIDASTAITDPECYRDHDHLNVNGVERLLHEIIRPAIAMAAM